MSKCLGFTGTRKGLTELQFKKLQEVVTLKFAEGYSKAIHGDCCGADTEFNEICFDIGFEVVCRPSNSKYTRARTNAKVISDPVHPMARNPLIVADADFMIGCPHNYDVIRKGSGTWNTIDIARKVKKPLIIVFPDGTSLEEDHKT